MSPYRCFNEVTQMECKVVYNKTTKSEYPVKGYSCLKTVVIVMVDEDDFIVTVSSKTVNDSTGEWDGGCTNSKRVHNLMEAEKYIRILG